MRSIAMALLTAAACAPSEPRGPSMTIERVRRDLLAEKGPVFEVIAAPPGQLPRAQVISPTVYELRASDRLALVLTPPTEVRWVVGKSDAPCFLQTAAGVDVSLARALGKQGLGPVSIRFEVLVGGRSVFDETVVTQPKLAREAQVKNEQPHLWHAVGGPSGIELAPGDEVRLRTNLPEPLPEGIAPPRAGFSDLLLVQHVERARTRASRERPNLVLVVMDTLRRDRTSLHGYSRPTTPELEALAARGLTYDSAWSTSSWTWPATASILTGLEPEAHGVISHESCHLVHELTTVAEVLQEEGYTCVAFTGNPLVAPCRNFDQGFERFDCTEEFRKSELFVPDALRWLEEHAEQRFFLYLHLVDPHTPHAPPRELMQRFTGLADPLESPDYSERLQGALLEAKEVTPAGEVRIDRLATARQLQWLSDVYDAEVAAGDYWLGQVLALLDELALAETTVVAFTADHGEELFDHGWLSHAHSLHEELVRVPLVLAGPGLPEGVRCATPVSTRSLAPTLAKLGGTSLPAAADALSLLAPEDLPHQPIFFDTRKGRWNGQQYVSIFGVLERGWMLHLAPSGQTNVLPAPVAFEGPESHLLRVSADAGGAQEAHADPGSASALRRAIEEHQRALAARAPSHKVGAGEATLQLLREAGYAGGEDEEER